MNPTELHTLFTDKEQTLLVATERARLTDLAEDDLDELLTRVRRARNKCIHLADGDPDGAMAEIEKVLRFMASGADMTGIEEPFRVRLDCYTVLRAVDDPRVDQVLDEAHAALAEAAARLRDDADRHRFLHDLPYHRALHEAWSARP